MQQQDIQVGDVVWLKSGSPSMTVDGFHQTSKNFYRCFWFNEEGNAVSEYFNQLSLTTNDNTLKFSVKNRSENQ
ncbi:DUF2158 domain-containing protein [Dyadobacter sp. CY107]|uniref:DUF2158 domain-containing protein n=1 Tax=Dyadobacter fanqingshengii TaxID=2906443 RepID=UPI001F34FE10|nr:DUF2158 domain-containing protein [Dyadobacter fanqingshengii]MCF2506383.1 DUF2158 domain-containing protein [Dyadobacter fanqingshengii]